MATARRSLIAKGWRSSRREVVQRSARTGSVTTQAPIASPESGEGMSPRVKHCGLEWRAARRRRFSRIWAAPEGRRCSRWGTPMPAGSRREILARDVAHRCRSPFVVPFLRQFTTAPRRRSHACTRPSTSTARGAAPTPTSCRSRRSWVADTAVRSVPSEGMIGGDQFLKVDLDEDIGLTIGVASHATTFARARGAAILNVAGSRGFSTDG